MKTLNRTHGARPATNRRRLSRSLRAERSMVLAELATSDPGRDARVAAPLAASTAPTHSGAGSRLDLMGGPDAANRYDLMGGADTSSRYSLIGDADAVEQLDLMGGPDAANRYDLMGGADASSRLDLMGGADSL
jgi:hypothetical protein